MAGLAVTPLPGIKLVEKGDNLAAILLDAIAAANVRLTDGDIVAVAQKDRLQSGGPPRTPARRAGV